MLRLVRLGRQRRQLLLDRLGGKLDPLVQMLFQDPGVGVLVVDHDGGVVRANETLRRMVSRRVDLSLGASAAAMFREVDRSVLQQALEGSAAVSNLPARLETADTDPDHMVDVAVTVLREEDGSVSGAMLRLTDITAQKTAGGAVGA